MSELTQDQANDALHYDPETGIFTRKIQTCGRVKVGDVAGYVRDDGYRMIRVRVRQYLAHRLAWLMVTGKFPENQIDHINGSRGDNRWCNLRAVTNTENDRNRAVRRDSASGVMGVRRHNRADGWVARITVSGKIMNLGFFKNIEDATAARKSAEAKHGYHSNSGRTRNA
ncbi:HNH endonuclease signature motif containing protein [Pseudomonas sp. BF-R-01]|uniref:HNH endonuclease signature motif containing protein n=1 Tax=Pseudomonas sp. BF-R-01 TaxID=2832365 RepID=UPI001CBF54CF|nr:HNH endonuclease signature motif containing protein [Pseudomonas sp. BF-R-01]